MTYIPINSIPGADDEVTIPAIVQRLTRTGQIRPCWVNEAGGMTFQLDAGTADDRYVKWLSPDSPLDPLESEADRMRWAGQWIPVPEVLESGVAEGGQWLVTRAIPGDSAVTDHWRERPETAVRALGRGLRALHDTLPVADCPWSWDLDARLERFERRLSEGLQPEHLMEEHRSLTLDEIEDRMANPPARDELVVAHGDACAPNTLLDASGEPLAYVDLGSLGIADRWADLAVGTWSVHWNYGREYEALYFEAYGIEPDRERIDFYRLAWDVC